MAPITPGDSNGFMMRSSKKLAAIAGNTLKSTFLPLTEPIIKTAVNTTGISTSANCTVLLLIDDTVGVKSCAKDRASGPTNCNRTLPKQALRKTIAALIRNTVMSTIGPASKPINNAPVIIEVIIA